MTQTTYRIESSPRNYRDWTPVYGQGGLDPEEAAVRLRRLRRINFNAADAPVLWYRLARELPTD